MKFLTKDKAFYKNVFALTFMLALQNVISCGVSLADNIMLGGYSEAALSGVSLANQIQFVLQMLVFGLGEGIIILGSQYWGKRDTFPIKKIINIGMLFALIISTIVGVVVFVFPHWSLSLFTRDEVVITEGIKYLQVICFSYIFFALTSTMLNGLKCVETVKIGLWVSMSTLLVNVFLNYVLIYGHFGFPQMGTAGAAVATLVSRVLEFIIVLVYYVFFDKKLHYKLVDILHIDRELIKDYIRVGTPIVLSNTMWGVAMGMQASILGHLGGASIAANSIASTVFQIISVVAYGASAAASVITGKTIGEGNMHKIKEYTRTLQVIFLVIGLVSGIALFLVKDSIIALYNMSGTLSPQTLALSDQFVNVLCISLMGTSYQVACLTGIVRGGGDTKFVLYNDFIFMWLIVLPLSAMAAFWWNWSPVAVFLCLKCDQVLKCFVAVVKVNSYNWVRQLTRKTENA